MKRLLLLVLLTVITLVILGVPTVTVLTSGAFFALIYSRVLKEKEIALSRVKFNHLFKK